MKKDVVLAIVIAIPQWQESNLWTKIAAPAKKNRQARNDGASGNDTPSSPEWDRYRGRLIQMPVPFCLSKLII
jgi:hypothetical protein